MSLFDTILEAAAKAHSGRTNGNNHLQLEPIGSPASTPHTSTNKTHDVARDDEFSPDWAPSEEGLLKRDVARVLADTGLRDLGVGLQDVLDVKKLHPTKRLPQSLYEAANYLKGDNAKKVKNINAWITWFLKNETDLAPAPQPKPQVNKTYATEPATPKPENAPYDYRKPYGDDLNDEEKNAMDKRLGRLPEHLNAKIIDMFNNKNWGVAWMNIYRYQIEGYDCDHLFLHYHQYYNALELGKIV